jgi:hypothetical protein
VGNLVFSGRIKPEKKVLDEPTMKTLRPLLLGIDIDRYRFQNAISKYSALLARYSM